MTRPVDAFHLDAPGPIRCLDIDDDFAGRLLNLAAVPDEDEDEEDDEPEIKRYSFPVTVTVYAEGTSPDEASIKAFNALCAASEAMGEVDFEFELGDADPEEEESW